MDAGGPQIRIQRCTVYKLRNRIAKGATAAARGTRRRLPPDDLRHNGGRRLGAADDLPRENGGGCAPAS